MGEDSGAVEGAVILGVVQPALLAVRGLAADAQADDVGAGVAQAVLWKDRAANLAPATFVQWRERKIKILLEENCAMGTNKATNNNMHIPPWSN